MSQSWLKALIVVLALAPLTALAEDKKDPPAEQTVVAYDSKTQGAIQVTGETNDWFMVLKDGKPLGYNPKLLGGTWAVEPGEYEVSVNKTVRKVQVAAGKKVVLLTGTLVVEGKGLYYAPYEGKERRVATNSNPPGLNYPISLFAGTYSVHVNENLRDVKVTDEAKVAAGMKTVLKH